MRAVRYPHDPDRAAYRLDQVGGIQFMFITCMTYFRAHIPVVLTHVDLDKMLHLRLSLKQLIVLPLDDRPSVKEMPEYTIRKNLGRDKLNKCILYVFTR